MTARLTRYRLTYYGRALRRGRSRNRCNRKGLYCFWTVLGGSVTAMFAWTSELPQLHVPFVRETAQMTLVGLLVAMGLHMLSESGSHLEAPIANITGVRTLVEMSLHVSFECAFLFEAHTAHFARIRGFFRVSSYVISQDVVELEASPADIYYERLVSRMGPLMDLEIVFRC